MFISYAQNYEDVMLWRALKTIEAGFYIDVGAAWPREHSVTKAFYDAGWSGINVEPNPDFHALLDQDRPRDCNLLLALAEHEGSADFVIFDATGLSTLDPEVASVHQEAGRAHRTRIVTVSTLSSVWAKHVPQGQPVHFLKIDVEGAEAPVLAGNDWSRNRPWIVVVEATVPMSQTESFADWEPLLLKANYQLAYADGLNRFYVAKERAALVEAFHYPPNFFDHFKLFDHHTAELRAGEFHALMLQAQACAKNAEEKAVLAQAHAHDAEEKAVLAQAHAHDAEEKAVLAQAHAHDAEARANQAQTRVLEIQQQKTEALKQVALLREQIDALHQSYSWRVTAPLRAIVRLFR